MRRVWSAAVLLLMILQVGCGGGFGGGDAAAAREAVSPGMAEPAAMPMSPPADSDSSEISYEVSGVTAEESADRLTSGSFKKEDNRTAMAQPARPGPPAPPAVQTPTPTGPAKGTPGQPQPVAGQPGASSSVVAQPMLIYTAEFTMAVFEVSVSVTQIEDIGREVGGFLSRRDDMAITIRVPANRFDEVVKRIEKVGDVLNRNVSAQDVTEEFADLEVRLRNARAIRDRLEQLLVKATKVEESLQIERELGRVAGEIERIEGKMKFLRDRAAYSTITVRFQARPVENLGPKKPRLPVPWLYEMGLGRLLNL
jgi:Domain of unknown function (DUF4349)